MVNTIGVKEKFKIKILNEILDVLIVIHLFSVDFIIIAVNEIRIYKKIIIIDDNITIIGIKISFFKIIFSKTIIFIEKPISGGNPAIDIIRIQIVILVIDSISFKIIWFK